MLGSANEPWLEELFLILEDSCDEGFLVSDYADGITAVLRVSRNSLETMD